MSELNYSIYMNQITVKIYELNMQNTKSFMDNKDMNSLISMTGKAGKKLR